MPTAGEMAIAGSEKMKLTFWGARGSIAAPGPDTLRFGGNTTCLEVKLPDCPPVVIDAGTGIRPLGLKMDREPGDQEIILLITHLHWDHILGFPFFEPAYRRGSHIRVGGWPRGMEGLVRIFDSKQVDSGFPLSFDQLPARIERDHSLDPPHFVLGTVPVRTMGLHHPQGALGYRFCPAGGDVVFITDHELEHTGSPQFARTVKFCAGAKVLIHDAQYLPSERKAFRGRGHSCWDDVLAVAGRAGVERLVLTHHDPERDDDAVEALVEQAQREAGSGLSVEAAYEGMVVEV